MIFKRPLVPFSSGNFVSLHNYSFLSTSFDCQSRLYGVSTSELPRRDGRSRLSRLWTPITGGSPSEVDLDNPHSLLIRAGFVQKAYFGAFHLLPFGLLVQQKLEKLIDKHMGRIGIETENIQREKYSCVQAINTSTGASKLLLSSISSEALWKKSGRYEQTYSEIIGLKERKDAALILSPTHEEEITSLVAKTVKSYKELPLRLYQISRKYRDEFRPRMGLLRTREFMMKDLYTFDIDEKAALDTYRKVHQAYNNFFNELKIPFAAAKASSGTIGGDISHEFHFLSVSGEDIVCICDSCSLCASSEAVERAADDLLIHNGKDLPNFDIYTAVTQNKKVLINAFYPRRADVSSTDNQHYLIDLNVLKKVFPNVDPGIENPINVWKKQGTIQGKGAAGTPQRRIVNIFDIRLGQQFPNAINSSQWQQLPENYRSLYLLPNITVSNIDNDNATGRRFDLIRMQTGDKCPRCRYGKIQVKKSIEVGHTFYLGTRYSEPLGASILIPTSVLSSRPSTATPLSSSSSSSSSSSPTITTTSKSSQKPVPIQMGCYGIGLSRLIAAVADSLIDRKGLLWPRCIAPFEVVIVASEGHESEALMIYDSIRGMHIEPNDAGANVDNVFDYGFEPTVDVVLDDRKKSVVQRLKDADLVGYPVIVVLGKEWPKSGRCEVQCRKLGIRKEYVLREDLSAYVASLLKQL